MDEFFLLHSTKVIASYRFFAAPDFSPSAQYLTDLSSLFHHSLSLFAGESLCHCVNMLLLVALPLVTTSVAPIGGNYKAQCQHLLQVLLGLSLWREQMHKAITWELPIICLLCLCRPTPVISAGPFALCPCQHSVWCSL